MPRLPEEQQALDRMLVAFGPVPRIDRKAMSRDDVKRFNKFVQLNAPLMVSRRERLVRRSERVLSTYVAERLRDVALYMRANGLFDQLERDMVSLYNDMRQPNETDAKVKQDIRNQARNTPRVENFLNRLFKQVVRSRFGPLFPGMRERVNIMRTLFAEDAALHTRKQIALRGKVLVVDAHLLQKAQHPDEFTEEESQFVRIVFGQRPTQLLDSIVGRQNKIRVVRLTREMFQDLKDVMREGLYENMHGALGARDVARKLVKRFESDLLDVGFPPDKIRNRLMVWARTESAVVQNDTQLKIAVEAGMDGKIWQSVLDDRVRTIPPGPGDHVANDAVGVIAITARFPDGSTDGGSGSVSPYNCRCVVGGALL